MRILVTGGSGLVGNGIKTVAVTFPHLNIILLSSKDGDLRNPDEVDQIFQRHYPVDAVIHLAANVGGLFKNMRLPVDMCEDNLLMNTNILRAAHRHDVQHVLCVLSTCIFPDAAQCYPITSQMLHDGPPHFSNEGYAYAKRIMEVLCRAYQRQYGRRYFCVAPTNIYGPHDNFDLDNAHVIPALIHKCYLAKKNNEDFVIAGDGSPLRQFIHSEDVAKILLWALTNYKNIESPIILAPSDSEVSIKNVATIIAEAFEFPKDRIHFDTSRPNGQHKKTADTAQLSSLCHGIDFVPLHKGINDTVKWFIDSKSVDTKDTQ